MLTFKEYISNDLIYLKRYLNQTEEEQKQSLPYEYPYLYDIYPDKKEMGTDDYSYYFEKIEGTKEFDEFAEWLYDGIKDYKFANEIPDSELPAWTFFDDNPKILKRDWLIHFSNSVSNIEDEGFTRGVDQVEKLGLTTHLNEYDLAYGGYNFAYEAFNFERYYMDRMGPKYGSDAVLFQAPGIKTYHYGDEEPQVIFWGKTATNIIPIYQSSDDKWWIENRKGGELYSSEDIAEVVAWAINNFKQYKNSMVTKFK